MRYIEEIIEDVKEGKALSSREERRIAIAYIQGKYDAIKNCEDCEWRKDREIFEGNRSCYRYN